MAYRSSLSARVDLANTQPRTAKTQPRRTESVLRVLVVEDDRGLRESLRGLLAWAPREVRLVACCARGKEALQRVEEGACFDVAVVDLGLPDMSGIDLIRQLRLREPRGVCIAFTVLEDVASILGALRAGARGYLLKSTPPERFMDSLHEAYLGGAPVSPEVVSMLIGELLDRDATPSDARLTQRETEVLRLLAKGLTYADIGSALRIGMGTVQSHVKSIYPKLDVCSKAEAAAMAVKLGLG